jgi:hypothetical protein
MHVFFVGSNVAEEFNYPDLIADGTFSAPLNIFK